MPQKLNIQYVSEVISQKSNGLSKVLTEEYVNDRTPLKIQCKCGKIFERTFAKIRGKGRTAFCKDCLNEIRSEKYRLDICDVIDYIKSQGCEYISGNYENNNSKLKIRCRCGNEFQKSFAKFKSGQNRCPSCGNEIVRESKIKYSVEDVKIALAEKGYKIIDEKEYIDSHKPIKCVCKRGHIVGIRYSYFIKGQSGCKKCADLDNSGNSHWNYNDGRSLVTEALRHSVKPWKKEIKEIYGNKCPITGETSYLVVHHLTSFDSILKESSEELGIPIYKTLCEYSDYNDFISLKERFVEKHTVDIGIPIRKKVHFQFHAEYGKSNNTPEQFDEFLRNHYNTSLEEIRKVVANEQQRK